PFKVLEGFQVEGLEDCVQRNYVQTGLTGLTGFHDRIASLNPGNPVNPVQISPAARKRFKSSSLQGGCVRRGVFFGWEAGGLKC
ncbi:MAG: hypothetical protein MJ240_07570, partial [Kiritimatiellae bacterium]|nr:hypothetical protein [Kiritimatiellia bacterium]